MGQIGLRVVCLSELGRGSMGLLGSMGTSTTGLIRTMGITDRFRDGVRRRSTTSKRMKRMMGMAT